MKNVILILLIFSSIVAAYGVLTNKDKSTKFYLKLVAFCFALTPLWPILAVMAMSKGLSLSIEENTKD